MTSTTTGRSEREQTRVTVAVSGPRRRRWGGMCRLASLAAIPLLGRGICSIFDQVIVSGANFATGVIVGRNCLPEELGVYYLGLSVVMFVSGLQRELVSAPYMVYCHQHEGKELRVYTGSTLVHHLLLTLVALAAGFSAAVTITAWKGEKLPAVAWILLGTAPLMLLREFLRNLCFARLRLGSALVLDLAIAFLQVGSLFLLAWWEMLSVQIVYCILGASCGAACIGWMLASRGTFAGASESVVRDWGRNWSFGKWAVASQLIGSTTPYVMPWILAASHGEAATGILGACTALVGLANMFVVGIANFLTPQAARAFATGGIPALQRVLIRIGFVFVVCLSAFLVLVVVTGDQLPRLVYGKQFGGTGAVIAVLAAALLANSLGITVGNGLCAMDRPSANLPADVTNVVVTIAGAALLVAPLGALGAASAALAGTVAGSVVRAMTLRRMMAIVAWEAKPAEIT